MEQNQAAPQQQIIQVQAPATQQPQQQQQQPMQVFTQVVGSNGEIQQVPVSRRNATWWLKVNFCRVYGTLYASDPTDC